MVICVVDTSITCLNLEMTQGDELRGAQTRHTEKLFCVKRTNLRDNSLDTPEKERIRHNA